MRGLLIEVLKLIIKRLGIDWGRLIIEGVVVVKCEDLEGEIVITRICNLAYLLR